MSKTSWGSLMFRIIRQQRNKGTMRIHCDCGPAVSHPRPPDPTFLVMVRRPQLFVMCQCISPLPIRKCWDVRGSRWFPEPPPPPAGLQYTRLFSSGPNARVRLTQCHPQESQSVTTTTNHSGLRRSTAGFCTLSFGFGPEWRRWNWNYNDCGYIIYPPTLLRVRAW